MKECPYCDKELEDRYSGYECIGCGVFWSKRNKGLMWNRNNKLIYELVDDNILIVKKEVKV